VKPPGFFFGKFGTRFLPRGCPAVDVAHSSVLDGSACARDRGTGQRERGEEPSRIPSPRLREARPLRVVVGGGQKTAREARPLRVVVGGGQKTAREARPLRVVVGGGQKTAREARPLRVV